MPTPVPVASVAGATRDRCEVSQRMAAAYSAMTTKNKIQDRGAPWGIARSRADDPVHTQENTPAWRGEGELLDRGLGCDQGQDRGVPADAKDPGCPAVASRPEEPACQQRQSGQHQHHIAQWARGR